METVKLIVFDVEIAFRYKKIMFEGLKDFQKEKVQRYKNEIDQARSLATINFPGTKAQYYGSIYYRNTMFLRQSIATSYITCTDGTVVI